MRADGTEQNQLTVCGGEEPSWSPDGTMIVYTKYLDNGSPENGVLWLIDVRSRTEKQLTFHPPCDQ
jgi:Tol biopolymer transport system component